jgi:hypothetical protein
MKAFLISVATLIVFDAVAWHGEMRYLLLAETTDAIRTITSLDWSWA